MLGLRMGADDYIKKPFSQRLLIERIRAVLRRRAPAPTSAGTSEPEVSWCRGAAGDGPRPPHVHAGRTRTVNLTVTEFLLLRGAGPSPRPCEDPRPADRRGLWRQHLCRRPHHRQPCQAACAGSSAASIDANSPRSKPSTALATATSRADREGLVVTRTWGGFEGHGSRTPPPSVADHVAHPGGQRLLAPAILVGGRALYGRVQAAI